MDPETETKQTETEAPRNLSLLARDRFGVSFHGDVKEAETEAEGETETEVETESNTGEETEPETEAETEPETEKDGEAEGETENETETTVSSFDELIESQDWDPEWAQSLKIPVKVDGQASEVTLADLKAEYQKGQAADKRLEEAKARRDQFDEQIRQRSDELTGHFAQAAKLIENAEALVGADDKAVDWAALKRDDPAEYASKKLEMQERRQEIERLKTEALEAYKKSSTTTETEMQQRRQEVLQREHAALMEAMPEWKDEAKAKEGKQRLATYLSAVAGFNEEDLANAADHRLIVLAEKARKFDESKGKVDTARKRVKTVPKVIKPGAAKPAGEAQSRKIKDMKARLQRTGRIEDAVALRREQKKAQL